MDDTRETTYPKGLLAMAERRNSARFKAGDHVLIPHGGVLIEQIPHSIFWDAEFGGWMLACSVIGVHEQNYILAVERDQWEPHENGLWSWWTRKEPSTPAGPDGPVADSADGYVSTADNRAEAEAEDCPHCHGCGREAGHHGLAGRCQWCKGTGRVEAEGSKA